MVTFKFYHCSDGYTGFKCSGHSGLSEEGTDIVCAAVSSVVRYCECAINDILKLSAHVDINEETAEVCLMLKCGYDSREEKCAQTIIEALVKYAAQLSFEYPDNIEVLIEKVAS